MSSVSPTTAARVLSARARRVVGEAMEDASIHLLEAALVDAHLRERLAGEGGVDVARALKLLPLASELQEAAGDARCAAAPLCEQARALGIQADAEDARRAVEDALEIRRGVRRQALDEPEAAAERAGEQTLASGRADEGERLDEDREHAGVGARVEGHLDPEVLHRGVEVLLDADRDQVDLVDEEDVAALEAGQQPEEVLRLVQGRAAGGVELAPELLGHDAGQAGLPRPGGPQKSRWSGARPALRRAEMSREVLDDAVLAHELVEARRAQADLGDPLRASSGAASAPSRARGSNTWSAPRRSAPLRMRRSSGRG